MFTFSKSTRQIGIALVFILSVCFGGNARAIERLTLAAVLDSMEYHFDKIQDYEVTVQVVMDVKGLRVPPMVATVYFKQSDHLRIKSKGFAMLPKHAVVFTPARLRKLIAESRILQENRASSELFHLKISPERADKNLEITLDFWIDLRNWVVRKIRTESNRFGWMEIENEFKKVEGQFWLPVRSRIRLDIDKSAFSRFYRGGRRKSAKKFLGNMAGKGQIYITFRNYRINRGLPDELFQSDAEK